MKKFLCILSVIFITLTVFTTSTYAKTSPEEKIRVISNWEEYFEVAENPEISYVEFSENFEGEIPTENLRKKINETFIVLEDNRTFDFNNQPLKSTENAEFYESISIKIRNSTKACKTITIKNLSQGYKDTVTIIGNVNVVFDNVNLTHQIYAISDYINVRIENSVLDYYDPTDVQHIVSATGDSTLKLSSTIIRSTAPSFKLGVKNSFKEIIDENSEIYLNGIQLLDHQYESSTIEIKNDGTLYDPTLEITTHKESCPEFIVNFKGWVIGQEIKKPTIQFINKIPNETDLLRKVNYSWKKINENEWHILGTGRNSFIDDFAPKDPGLYTIRAAIRANQEHSSFFSECVFEIKEAPRDEKEYSTNESIITAPPEQMLEQPIFSKITSEEIKQNTETTFEEKTFEDIAPIPQIPKITDEKDISSSKPISSTEDKDNSFSIPTMIETKTSDTNPTTEVSTPVKTETPSTNPTITPQKTNLLLTIIRKIINFIKRFF